jgi:nitrate reductase gamma subunit
MHDFYHFITGPLAAFSIAVFFGGILYKIISIMYSVYKREKFIFSYMSLRYSLRSLIHWLTPFATENMRQHPYMTIVTFVFHSCIFLVPVFLLSHIVLLDESLNIGWRALPDPIADFMTILVIGACVFFGVRRIVSPEVRYLTSTSDFFLLGLAALPFVSGFYAFHQWPGYTYALILHILSGEILLIAIPFTRLSHMIVGLFTRIYTGSEFGSVRHAKDW